MIVVREGNTELSDEEKTAYSTIKSFLDLTFQAPAKRQKLEKPDDKVDEGTADVSEPMDTSEDVEMSDINDKKIEKKEEKVTESVGKECVKDQPSEDTSISLGQVKESAVKKDASNTEKEMIESDAKLKNTNKDTGSSESAKCTMKDDTATLATKDNDKDTVTEKTEENLDKIATEITTTADDSMDVTVSESVSKSDTILTSSEKKTEVSIDTAKDIQTEDADKTLTESDEKADGDGSQSQTCDKNITNKSEELAVQKDEVKEESKVVSGTSESENILAKSEQEATKTETTDVTENGEAVETEKATEKTTASVTETETEATVTEVRKEATASTEVSAGKSSEVTAESEKVDEKITQGMETKTTDADKLENETTQQETIKEKETVKEENIVDTKDKNTVDSEKQKLNGTTNGNTDVPVLDDKLHSNGLNEGPSKETTNEDAAAQNGEPESLSESSAESIKVKKVVDSAVADGAGEPDVVPPVVVAATS